jgi:hypothetical protein
MDVTVERAACALLLGDPPQALQLLGLSDRSAVQQSSSDDSVAEFVLVSRMQPSHRMLCV